MVITVSCPSCATSFPVDPNKIPEGGVKVRCSSCAEIFRVERPAPPAPEPPPLPTLEEPAPTPTAEEAAPLPTLDEPPPLPTLDDEPPPLPTLDDTPAALEASSEPAAATDDDLEIEHGEFTLATEEQAPEPTAPPPAAEPTAPEPAGTGTVQGFTFGRRDPTDKAKRLARVLVSDMVMYNAERHQTALASGTLAQDFEEEIEKSWKEFVEQVGHELAEGPGRQFWREALNDILARGKELF